MLSKDYVRVSLFPKIIPKEYSDTNKDLQGLSLEYSKDENINLEKIVENYIEKVPVIEEKLFEKLKQETNLDERLSKYTQGYNFRKFQISL